eukprot:CAMPEP_0172549298 /NCGR_PEP_ID=MMETSP1067-20121228/18429_1 /TAXON_ID=265564 ORGANISM="Thalassiosira punctigera, Strain Tpunct2005C2" /NCGR_SAMPLE_ID=MMETSP1067 /ASSEMBLY_ACC=CAM_ASM_000444 /LENGTH=246 /DNA_ID=CAMNT_0013336669 /DNA_START=296 /DNA_END=1032 /DNA_ORIENTATION=+
MHITITSRNFGSRNRKSKKGKKTENVLDKKQSLLDKIEQHKRELEGTLPEVETMGKGPNKWSVFSFFDEKVDVAYVNSWIQTQVRIDNRDNHSTAVDQINRKNLHNQTIRDDKANAAIRDMKQRMRYIRGTEEHFDRVDAMVQMDEELAYQATLKALSRESQLELMGMLHQLRQSEDAEKKKELKFTDHFILWGKNIHGTSMFPTIHFQRDNLLRWPLTSSSARLVKIGQLVSFPYYQKPLFPETP